eukprot:2151031-Prymnesium_polylepis.1
MDSSAIDFRAIANIPSACTFAGCTDSEAINFDEKASLAIPSSCELPVSGCTSSLASNFRAPATVDDGSCKYVGCTDSQLPNFDPSATVDSGRCTPLRFGCTNPIALNYNAYFNTDDGSCFILGCTDPTSSYYVPEATYNIACWCDGTCAPSSAAAASSHGRRADPAAGAQCGLDHGNTAAPGFEAYVCGA